MKWKIRDNVTLDVLSEIGAGAAGGNRIVLEQKVSEKL